MEYNKTPHILYIGGGQKVFNLGSFKNNPSVTRGKVALPSFKNNTQAFEKYTYC